MLFHDCIHRKPHSICCAWTNSAASSGCGNGYYATSQYTCCPVGTKLISGLCYPSRNTQTDILSSGANLTAILAQNGITSQSLLAAVIGSFFNTQSGKHVEVKYYTNGTRYFCAEPNSPIAVMLTHLIQVELLSIKQLMNQTEIDQLNHAIPKIQAIICPRE
jgi:hypothetical protein